MARSSFMGRRLDSCLHANHSLYRCRQERSGPGSRLGLKGPFILTQVVDCMIEKTNNLKQIIHYKLDQKIQHLFKYSSIYLLQQWSGWLALNGLLNVLYIWIIAEHLFSQCFCIWATVWIYLNHRWIYTVPNDAHLPHSNCSLKLTETMKGKY